MIRTIARLALGLAVVLGGSRVSAADAPRAVVELFTSQGCSSCPPADRLLGELVRDPDVIGLSLSVDYWDYLGWKDTMAKPAFTARQRAYASVRRDKQVFTPQVIVNGAVPCLGSDRGKIDQALRPGEAEGRPALSVPLTTAEGPTSVTVEVGAARGPAPKSAELWLVPVKRSREVAIGRGENRGRTLTYVNVVRDLAKIGTWTGAPARFEVPLRTARVGEADSYVVLLQVMEPHGPGAIIGAAKGPGL